MGKPAEEVRPPFFTHDPGEQALAICREITVERSSIRYRSSVEEVKDDVLFILRRGCRAGVELL